MLHGIVAFVFGLAILAASLATDAQQASRVPRIGYLEFGTAAPGTPLLEAFRQGLRELGWVEGQNIAIEVRYAEGKRDQLPELAAELVRRKVDLIFASTTPAALAAKHATTTIPIVIGFVGDPVGSGVVASLARPGGNITGWTHLAGLELAGKRLELIKETVPGATRIGALWNPANPGNGPFVKELEAAAQALKVQLHPGGCKILRSSTAPSRRWLASARRLSWWLLTGCSWLRETASSLLLPEAGSRGCTPLRTSWRPVVSWPIVSIYPRCIGAERPTWIGS